MIQQTIQESLKECKLNGATIFMSCSYYHCSDDSQLSVSDIIKEQFSSTIGLLTDERQKLVQRRHVCRQIGSCFVLFGKHMLAHNVVALQQNDYEMVGRYVIKL